MSSTIEELGGAVPPNPARRRARGLASRLLVGVLALGLVLSGGGISEDVAEAAPLGPAHNGPLGYLGGYIVGGVVVYCLQPLVTAPTGTTSFAGNMQWPTMSATENARVSWAISTYGQTADPNWASAVNLYVWSLADPAAYNSHAWPGDEWYKPRIPVSERSTVFAYLAQLRAQDDAIVAGASGGGSGLLTFSVDESNNYLGTVTISALSPASATGTVTLTNGIFSATGTNVILGVTAGMVLDVQGMPPTDDGALYKISGIGNFSSTGGWRPEVGVYTTPGQQTLAGPGRPAVSTFSIEGIDPADRATVFQPAVTTQVASKFIESGQAFDDVVTFTTVPDSDGQNNPWYQSPVDSLYVPITATGTVYGPFLEQPVESDTVPIGAPIAGTATVTSTFTAGPTSPYTVTSDDVAPEVGFYTWVWEIDGTNQSAFANLFLPDNYSFVDKFGQVAETQVSPMQLRFSTELTTGAAGLGDTVDDTISTYTIGGWLRQNGDRIPVVLSGTAYWSAEQPAVSDTIPATAEAIGTYTVTTDRPQPVTAEGISVGVRPGWVTLRWCVDPAAQPAPVRGITAGWCDQYGVPAETAQVTGPTIVTAAQPTTTPADTVTDTAIISGTIPTSGIDITFQGFLQPADTEEPICDVDNAIYSSTAPIRVTSVGEYVSEKFDVETDHVGTVYWIETARLPGGSIIHVGECGLANETTEVKLVELTTKATGSVTLGERAHDVALLTGVVPPGSTITFDAFMQPKGTPTAAGGQLDQSGVSMAPICEADNQVFDGSATPIDAPAGNYPTTLEIEGPQTVFTEAGTYFWVETLRANDGEILHQGACGALHETTLVKTPLAFTGASTDATPWFARAAVVILLGVMILVGSVVWNRRRGEVETS